MQLLRGLDQKGLLGTLPNGINLYTLFNEELLNSARFIVLGDHKCHGALNFVPIPET